MSGEQIDCCICLESLNSVNNKALQTNQSPEKVVVLDCKHQFHLDCIKQINGVKCPLCRNNIINRSNENTMCLGTHKLNTHFYSSPITKKGMCCVCKKPTFNFYLLNKITKEKQYSSLTNTKKKLLSLSFWKTRKSKGKPSCPILTS
jgi:hypothetical protein